MSIKISPDRQHLIDETADYIANIAAASIAARKRFTIAMSGGSTPRPVYARLSTPPYVGRIDWSKTDIFFGDERCVPPDDERSNFLMVRTALLEHVPIAATNVHRIHGEDNPDKAAADYSTLLETTFGGKSGEGPPATGFDLILLGMGDNGHTASLFPGMPAVTEKSRWVLAQNVTEVDMWRITITPAVINAARNVAFLVSGADKADMLTQVLEGPYEPTVLPAQIVKPANGELTWLVDAPAAARLRRTA